jgi:hypothetical protein
MRTINEAELKKVLSKLSLLNTIVGHAIQQKAFPPLFTPKKGEIIFVRYNDQSPWRLETFVCMVKDKYRCNSLAFKPFDWGYAKPQTPTQKGEG